MAQNRHVQFNCCLREALGDPNKQLAEVVPLEKSNERQRCVLKADDDILLVLDLTAANPFPNVPSEILGEWLKIADHQSAHGQAPVEYGHKQLRHMIRAGRQSHITVVGD